VDGREEFFLSTESIDQKNYKEDPLVRSQSIRATKKIEWGSNKKVRSFSIIARSQYHPSSLSSLLAKPSSLSLRRVNLVSNSFAT
jgi:hypothetical protein